jgi:hypothetical protein
MPYNHKTVGLNSAGAYQVSGAPFLSGAAVLQASADGAAINEVQISFPSVTKSVTVINKNNSVDLLVHFASRENSNVINGRRYITLKGLDSSMTFNVKCRKIWISSAATGTATGSFEMLAELTPIASDYDLSGSSYVAGAPGA